jgi:hypothetical protein
MLPVTTTSERPSPVTSPIATAELPVVPSEIAWYGRKSADVAFTPDPAANGMAIAAVAVKAMRRVRHCARRSRVVIPGHPPELCLTAPLYPLATAKYTFPKEVFPRRPTRSGALLSSKA